ncbi:MAG: hypothetical protein AB7G28_22835 [Pirellulales bacterium]
MDYSMEFRQDKRRLWAVRPACTRFAVASLLLMLLASVAGAQQYQSDEVDEEAGKLKLTAEQCVKNPARFAQDKTRFIDFFDKYYFPAMTRSSPDELGQLGRMRDDLFGRFLWATTDENLQSELTQMAFKKLQPIERNKGKSYHPAVRYNAVLILGMLDSVYPTAGQQEVPLKEATAELVLIVNFAAEGKPVPPFLVVGALVGLQRHVQHIEKLDRATAESIAAAVLKLSGKEVSLPETDAKVVEWIRTQAASILARLGNPGANGEVVAAMTNMIAGDTTPKMSLDGRVQVAAMLKQLKLDGAKIDAKTTADALLELAFAVAEDEAKEAKTFTNMQLQSGGFGGVAGPSGKKSRMKFDPATQEVTLDKRILLARLTDLQTGLSAFQGLAPAEKQPTFAAVLAAIAPVLQAAQGTETDISVTGAVEDMEAKVREAVKPGSAPPSDGDANIF